MRNLQQSAVAALVLRRNYPVPRERVFAAWTDPQTAARFLGPGATKATVAHMDVRIGGTFSIAMDSPEHERFVARGTYLEVDAPKRLVMTWRWEEDDPADEYDSLLSLDFNERDGSTEFVLTHEKLQSVESRARHEEGWTAIVDQLATVLTEPMNTPPIVSAQEWEAARERLLVKEKALTRARDALAAERRRMPWVPVEKTYAFDGPSRTMRLLDLFEGRRQLIVYRAFFEPGVFGWPEHACRGCSMVADQVAHVAHLNARDTSLAFVSRAPIADIERVKARMGWNIPWYSMADDFDRDFGVDEWHGTNVFYRDGERVFRTYFINNRGDEAMGSTWSYLDITPLGRQEAWEDSPAGYPKTEPYTWWNWHDNYAADDDRGWRAVVEAALET